MVFFYLAMQPLIQRISQTCNLWYADDGKFAGPLTEVLQALHLLISEGP